jgi:hypothetical protein
MITAGKLFMGNFVLTSDYYAANTTGFMNRDISNDRAGRYFDIIGLGMQARWQQERWYVSMGFADVKAEDSVRLAFQHDYADQAEYALYGRYTWRNGGQVQTGRDPNNELPTKQGGFVGWRWNRAFGYQNQQFAVAGFYGKMNAWQRSTGFDRHQYGMETFWRYDWKEWASITFDLQVMKNIENDWEAVPGLRLKLTGLF